MNANTLYSIVGLFSIGALAGIYLLTVVLQNKQTPKFVSLIHGGCVVIAFTMLIMYSLEKPGPVESIVLFAMAALGGLVLIYRDLAGKPIPKWLAITHGLLAVTGFSFLLAYVF
jgi:hypothetical protein